MITPHCVSDVDFILTFDPAGQLFKAADLWSVIGHWLFLYCSGLRAAEEGDVDSAGFGVTVKLELEPAGYIVGKGG